MIDLVGDSENQLPSQLKNKAIITNNFNSKIAHIQRYIEHNRDKKILVFTETKNDAREFERLHFANFLPIHGDMEQVQREKSLEKFKHGGSKYVLVGTDVAARGIDIDDVDVVIQVGCREKDSFVHRAGRTARRGKEGLNILFFEKDAIRFVLGLEKDLNIKMEFTNQIESGEGN